MNVPIIESHCPLETEEDYKRIFQNIDFENKIVLDIGADKGSTPSFFLRQGAKEVIAVEVRKDFITEMENKLAEYPINIIEDKVSSTQDFEYYISEFKPDIVKIDIEGDEETLPDISDDLFKIPYIYIIETHFGLTDRNILSDILNKIIKNGYKLTYFEANQPPTIYLFQVRKYD